MFHNRDRPHFDLADRIGLERDKVVVLDGVTGGKECGISNPPLEPR